MNLLIYLIFTAQSILAQEVEIAIIDSGISKVQSKNIDYKKGFNFVENSNNFPALEKDNNHGTAAAGILAGFPLEERGIKVIPIQFANLSKKSLSSHRENYYKALELAISKKVDIISLSIVSHWADEKEEELIKKAIKNNIKVFVASGNEEKNLKENPTYPCSYNIKKVVCVGNINADKKIISNWGEEVDIYVVGAVVARGNQNDLVYKNGSSSSTAIVAHNWAKFIIKKEKRFLNFLNNNNIIYKRNNK